MIGIHENKLLKNMYKINIPSVHLKKIIFIPMIAPKLKLEESLSYERPDLKPGQPPNPIQQATVERRKDPKFTTDKNNYEPQKMVKIRILSSVNLDVDFKTRHVRESDQPKA